MLGALVALAAPCIEHRKDIGRVFVITFRQIALLSLPVNALVLPAQTGVMLFGGLALLTGSNWAMSIRIGVWPTWSGWRR